MVTSITGLVTSMAVARKEGRWALMVTSITGLVTSMAVARKEGR